MDVKAVVGKEKSEEEGEGEGEGDLSESSGKSRVTYSGSWATDKEGHIFSHQEKPVDKKVLVRTRTVD